MNEQMQYLKVKFMYDDGKQAEAMLDGDRCNEMMKTLERREVFWFDGFQDAGMWLDISKIRYIQFIKQKRGLNEKQNEAEKVEASDSELLDENGANPDYEGVY